MSINFIVNLAESFYKMAKPKEEPIETLNEILVDMGAYLLDEPSDDLYVMVENWDEKTKDWRKVKIIDGTNKVEFIIDLYLYENTKEENWHKQNFIDKTLDKAEFKYVVDLDNIYNIQYVGQVSNNNPYSILSREIYPQKLIPDLYRQSLSNYI